MRRDLNDMLVQGMVLRTGMYLDDAMKFRIDYEKFFPGCIILIDRIDATNNYR